MAINSTISRTRDLNSPTIIDTLPHILAMGDKSGDRFDIIVTRGDSPVDMSQAGVAGYFIRLEDGKPIDECETVLLSGSSGGSVASVVLPQSCYVTPGQFALAIYATLDGVQHAIYLATGYIAQTNTTTLIDPGHTIPDITELLAQIDTIKGEAKLYVKSTEFTDRLSQIDNEIKVTKEGINLKVNITDYEDQVTKTDTAYFVATLGWNKNTGLVSSATAGSATYVKSVSISKNTATINYLG